MNISNLKTSGQVRLSDHVLDTMSPQVDVPTKGVEGAINRVRQSMAQDDKNNEMKKTFDRVDDLISKIDSFTTRVDVTDRNIMQWLPIINQIALRVRNLPSTIDSAVERLKQLKLEVEPSQKLLDLVKNHEDNLNAIKDEHIQEVKSKGENHLSKLKTLNSQHIKDMKAVNVKHQNDMKALLNDKGVWLSTRMACMLLIPSIVFAISGWLGMLFLMAYVIFN